MTRNRDGFKLSTGRTIYANNNILGINQTGVFEGYDGELGPNVPYNSDLNKGRAFTADEKREIAEYAIKLWTKWGRLPRREDS